MALWPMPGLLRLRRMARGTLARRRLPLLTDLVFMPADPEETPEVTGGELAQTIPNRSTDHPEQQSAPNDREESLPNSHGLSPPWE